MANKPKSGQQVVKEFFTEIRNIEGVDKKTVELLASLYEKDKLTDTHIQNGLEELLKDELGDEGID